MIGHIRKWYGRRFPSDEWFAYIVKDWLRFTPGITSQTLHKLTCEAKEASIRMPQWAFNRRLSRLVRSGAVRSWEGPKGERVYALPMQRKGTETCEKVRR